MDAPWSFGPTSVAAFILFIGVLIFVHELGHFLAAKLFDIKVVKFSLGFGQPLIAFTHGETTYQIAMVPLGGFVKMVGEHPGEELPPEDRARSFSSAPVGQRAIVALAGPAFNLAFPVLCFFAYNLLGPTVAIPIIGQVEPGRPAARAGLRPGDQFLAVDGVRTYSFSRVQELVSARPNETLQIRIQRGDEVLDLPMTPDATVSESIFGNRVEKGIIGVALTPLGTRVGIDDPRLAPEGLRTGDRIAAVAGNPVTQTGELVQALAKHRGRAIEMMVARSESRRAGDLLLASQEEMVSVSAEVPAGFDQLADLGLAPASGFVRSVVPGGAADRAGIAPGDRIIAVDGTPVGAVWGFYVRMEEAEGAPMEVTIRRGGAEKTVTVRPEATSCIHAVSRNTQAAWDSGLGAGSLPSPPSCDAVALRQQRLGAWSSTAPIQTEQVRLSLGESFTGAVRQTGAVIGTITTGLFKIFTGGVSLDNVGGPGTVFKVTAQAVEAGWLQYLFIMALVSVNLGLVNLLPIPLFDGGHLLFCLVEAVKRRPVSMRTRELANIVGLVVIVALLLLALRNDILSLGFF